MREERERATKDAEEKKRALLEHTEGLVVGDAERLLNPAHFDL